MPNTNNYILKGAFTFVGFLFFVVIVGGFLAAAQMFFDPLEKFVHANDIKRKETMNEVSFALQAYFLTNRTYPANSTSWAQDLVDSGDLKSLPSRFIYISSRLGNCGSAEHNYKVGNFCYTHYSDPPVVQVWTTLESDTERSKCPFSLYGIDPGAYLLWNSNDNRIGIVCTKSPAIPIQGISFENYY